MKRAGAALPMMLVALALLGGVTACSSLASPKAGTCLGALGSSPGSPAPTPTASATAAAGKPPTGMEVVAAGAPRRVPSVSVPCFDDSGDVRLDGVTRPTVINLWASWCQPCQAEMPGVAAFATAARSEVDVVGVDTADTRTGGRSMISEFDLSFPLLFDEDKRLANALGDTALPATLFVAPGGQIRAIYTGDALDATTLRAWTAQYLGVRVG